MKTIIYFFSLVMIATAANAQGGFKETVEPGKWDKTPLISNSRASIAGKAGGEITKAELLNSKGVETSDSAHHISGFKLTIAEKDKEPAEFASEHSGKLTEVMRDAIKKTPAGSKLFFEYIYCSTKENMSHTVDPMTFVLK